MTSAFSCGVRLVAAGIGVIASMPTDLTAGQSTDRAPDAGECGIGALVFKDLNGNGQFEEETEYGVDGVIVRLFEAETLPGGKLAIATTVTRNGGAYYFGDLHSGSYLVNIPASEFAEGRVLYHCLTTTKNVAIDGRGITISITLGNVSVPSNDPGSAEGIQSWDDGEIAPNILSINFGFAPQNPAVSSAINNFFRPLPEKLEALLVSNDHHSPNIVVKGHENEYSDQFPNEFRTIDGTRNNLDRVRLGAAATPLRRLVKNDYADGKGQPAGGARANARAISNVICAQHESTPNSRQASDYLWQWGQFLDHDVDEIPSAVPVEAFDILIPEGDPYFDPLGTGNQRIPVTRSGYINDSSGVRQQVNLITSFIDGSGVYGSDSERAEALRTNDGTGRLKTSDSPHGPLLPFNEGGLPNAGGAGAELFLAGDVRANEQVGLTCMHTLFVREHNHWAAVIRTADPALDGEQIYELAKVIVAAEIQVITYNEFLPLLVGEGAIPTYSGYDSNIDPGISNLFATAAYRVGHTMLSPELQRIDSKGESISDGPIALRDGFFNPQEISNWGLEPYLLGLSVQTAQAIDTRIVDDVRNFLFGLPGAGGFDLAALNIQRGREHGLAGYNEVRQRFGLAPVETFNDYAEVEPGLALSLAAMYDSPGNMDAWVGLLGERHVKGALVGETLRAILIDQFTRLRDGDRFWYQNYLSEPLQQILNGQQLSDVILRNSNIAKIQKDVFRVSPTDGPGNKGPAKPGSGRFASSWEEWLANGWAASAEALMMEDADVDGEPALMEYALGQVDTDGFATGAGLRLEVSGMQIDAVVKIPAGIGDLNYHLELSADRIAWNAAENPSLVTPSSDGYQELHFADIGSSIGMELGYVRLRVEHIGTGRMAIGPEQAWYSLEIGDGFSSIGMSVLKRAAFAGAIAAIGVDYVEFLNAEFADFFEGGGEYYVEVIDGDCEGHRYEVNEAASTGSGIRVDVGSSATTASNLSPDLVGARAILRKHHTLEDLLPLDLLSGSINPASSDQVHMFENGRYHTYFLLDGGEEYHHWTSMANAQLKDEGVQPICPGRGLFVKRAPGQLSVSLVVTGEVRSSMFCQRLAAGYNLVAGGYPAATSPVQRRLGGNNGFLGGLNPAKVDQFHIWGGDSSDDQRYDSYFLLDAGEASGLQYWTSLSSASLDSVDRKPLFAPGRAAFIQLRESEHPFYRWAAP